MPLDRSILCSLIKSIDTCTLQHEFFIYMINTYTALHLFGNKKICEVQEHNDTTIYN